MCSSDLGAGKSFLSKNLQGLVGKKDCTICSSDDYFYDDKGNYNFNPELLYQNHNKCKLKFFNALGARVPLVIVANTNTKAQDFNYYIEKAKQFGYIVHSLIVENREGTVNSHSVPEETLKKQENAIRENLKLR